MIKKFLLIIAVVLLLTNPLAGEDKAEYIIAISKDEGPSTVINLQSLQQTKLKVEVKNKAKADDKVKDGTSVTTICDSKCAELITIEQSSMPTRDGYAMFTIIAKDKAGSQILSFNADGIKTVPVKIIVTKPTYTMTVKGTEAGKARDITIGEDNLIEVEIKEGNTPIADGVEVQAIIEKNERAFFEGTVPVIAVTRNGVATFHLKPKDVNATATISFQLKDSVAKLKINISQLSFYQAIVAKTVSQLLGYIAILAAIGTVSMGLLEALKWNDFIKGITQDLFFRRYLKTKTADTKAIAENIIKAAYGRCDKLEKKLFYRQTPEGIIKQAKQACSDVINGVETGMPDLQKFIEEACPPIESPQDKTQEQNRRIEHLNTYFDAVLVEMNARWKFWNQAAAVVISILIIRWTFSYFYPSADCGKIFALSFFGGLLAPMAKDFTTSASSIINKMKA